MRIKIKKSGDIVRFSVWECLKNWFRSDKQQVFYSTAYCFRFSSPSDYWRELGKRDALVQFIAQTKAKAIRGMSFEEVLQRVAGAEFSSGCGVVVYDVSTEFLGRIADRFPGNNLNTFMEDIVFIQCSTREEVRKVVSRLSPSFGRALGIDRGTAFCNNENNL